MWKSNNKCFIFDSTGKQILLYEDTTENKMGDQFSVVIK